MLVLAVLLMSGCGRSVANDETTTGGTGKSGRIEADGSSTVGPYVTAAAERFRKVEPGVQITVGISGTGGGFERFCRGETDLSDASRPIEPDEAKACRDKGIAYKEIQVANDGIAVVVNKQNTWATCLTVAQLKKIWDAGSKVKTWRDVDPKFPSVRLTLAGPGTDSGTFDFFTKAINGEEDRSRSDYQASENDNVIVQAVAGDKGGLGYFGLSYYEQNRDKLKALGIDGSKGCVKPSRQTVQSGEYTPLARPLFVYVKQDSLARPEVKAFLRYMVDHERAIARAAQFVPLTEDQLAKAKAATN
jgi:phosphate transport system substrate-binding protein